MLFTPVFIFLTLVSSIEERHICRPPFRHESFFLYLFLQIAFLARCHYPSGPRVTFLVAIRNQPRFLKLQKDGRKKVAATEIMGGKANPRYRERKREERGQHGVGGRSFFESFERKSMGGTAVGS